MNSNSNQNSLLSSIVGDVIKKTFKKIAREHIRKIWIVQIKPELEKFKKRATE